MYQALYRKWRPQTFDDVVGQEQVTDTLKNQIISGRLSHAYLFVGTRGTGKTTCAKILAKAVNCEHPENGNPCNKCKSCIGIDEGSIMDVVELDAASNNGVDNVRALRDEAIFSPAIVKKRVYIIDEVHMLSTSAFNALLKILEEPPEHLMFILATTELQKVPATILSRCQRHSFKRIDPDKLAGRISFVAEQENTQIEPDAAELLARLADGSLRDGLSLLDQCSSGDRITSESVLSAMGLAGNLRVVELLNSVSQKDTQNALNIFSGLWNDGKAPATLLAELGSFMRDILMLKVAPKGGSELLSGGFDRKTLLSFAERMSSDELICNINSIQAHIGSLRDGRDPKVTAELCIIGLCEPELSDSIDALKKRIAKLEKMLAEGTKISADIAPIKSIQSNAQTEQEAKTDDEPPFEIEDEEKISRMDNENQEESELFSEEDSVDEAEHDKRDEELQLDNLEDEEAEASEISEKDNYIAPTEVSSDAWKDLLALLKQSMQQGQYTIISNSVMAKGYFSDDSLTIGVANAFVKGQLEQPKTLECIRNAAQTFLGKPIIVKIVEDKLEQNGGTEKLDVLSRFGNVKFE